MPKIFVDETYYYPDRSLRKFIVAHVIASDEAIREFNNWHKTKFLPDTIRFKNKSKIHYTDEDAAGKACLVDAVNALTITAKIYVWCDKGDTSESKIIKWSLGYQQQCDPDSEFYIEESSNHYDGLKGDHIHVVASKDEPCLALADIFAGVYKQKINLSYNQSRSAIDRAYTLLYPRIRFECIQGFDGVTKYNTRGNITQ